MNIIINIIVSILTGLASGLVSGWCVNKYFRRKDAAREQILRQRELRQEKVEKFIDSLEEWRALVNRIDIELEIFKTNNDYANLRRTLNDFPVGDHALDERPSEHMNESDSEDIKRLKLGIASLVSILDAEAETKSVDYHEAKRFVYETQYLIHKVTRNIG